VSQCNWLKAIFLEEIIQILTQHFKHEASMSSVPETLECPDDVECSGVLLAELQQDGDLDLSLASIRRMVLEYFDSHHIVTAMPPAFHHLTKRTLTQELQHLCATTWQTVTFNQLINWSFLCGQNINSRFKTHVFIHHFRLKFVAPIFTGGGMVEWLTHYLVRTRTVALSLLPLLGRYKYLTT